MRFRLLAAIACIFPSFSHAEKEVSFHLRPGQIETDPSFEACSYYFRPPAGAGRTFRVEFRRAGEEAWRDAFAPVTDQPTGVWKGSLFDLTEDSAWQLRVLTAGGAEVISPVQFRTWSSHPPIAKMIDLSQLIIGPEGLIISDQGSAAGWIKYTAPAGWTLVRAPHADDPTSAAITFRHARYVILENVAVVGGQRHGVLVDESEAVRILNCDISGWGRVGEQRFSNTGKRGMYYDEKGETINLDGGVEIRHSAGTVVERCYVHDPRGRANSWMFAHPAGPSALHVDEARGGTVVRWNDFVGSDEHRWNDVIESSRNGSPDGGFFRDADISGNFLAFGNDDGIELEGGGMNVRFYRNKIEGTTCGVSTGACIYGPQFVYENLVANPGDESGLALMFFKNSHGADQGGKRHFVNNTLYGAHCSAYGAYGKPIGVERLGFMRNNLFVVNCARLPGAWARRDDFDHDLFWTGGAGASKEFLGGWRAIGQEKHGIAADPQFVAPSEGDFHLATNSPARGAAQPVANLAPAGENAGAFVDAQTEVPFRPLALTAIPRQLTFATPGEISARRVTVSVPATAKEPVSFAVKKNRAFTWFEVRPAAGTVAPGETLVLTVTVDAAALRGRPAFKGAFLVRTPSGLSRPVSVYAAADFQEDLRPASAPHSVYLEAASLINAQGLVQATSARNVTGGHCVALVRKSPELAARFTLPAAGAYSLLARARFTGDVMHRRNFALTVDGAKATDRVAINTDYEWNTGATNFRVVYLYALGELAAGEHRLSLRLLNDELKLNELIVTDNPAAFFVDDWQKEKDAK